MILKPTSPDIQTGPPHNGGFVRYNMSHMNDYEQKMLQEGEGRMVGAGIGLIFMSPILAFIFAALIAGFLSLPFNPVFYTVWALIGGFGVLCFYATFKERAERKRKEAKSNEIA